VALAVVVLATAAAGLLAGYLADRVGLSWRGFLSDRDHLLRMTLAGRLPEFAIGMVVAFVHRDGRLLASRWARLAGPLVPVLMAVMGVMMVLKDSAPAGGQYALHLGVSVATGALILVLCTDHRPGRLLGWTPLVYLGRISYAFYLVQLTVVAVGAETVADRCGPWRLLVLLTSLLAASAVLYESVEKPARRAIVGRWASRGSTTSG